MAVRIRHIATRFALILALAAAAPLLAYGVASIRSLQQGTRTSVVTGNLNVATRAADEIGRYVTTNAVLLKAVAADLQDTGLQAWQQDRILKNDVLELREFREITLLDESGKPIATSRAGEPRLAIPSAAPSIVLNGVGMSPIHVDEDLLPTAVFSIHLTRLNQPDGWLVGEFSLEEMWKTVDAIRIPARGYALVAAPDGTLIAHGDPDKKAMVAKGVRLTGRNPLAGRTEDTVAEYVDQNGERQLGVAARIASLNWTVIVEQPTSDAYATADALRRELLVAIGAAFAVMALLGFFFGRRFIAPIFELRRGTQAVAQGRFETRVAVKTEDELGQLGDAFNSMTATLNDQQERLKKHERQEMFVRLARGLFHDLMHPFQNIGNSARLLVHPEMTQDDRRELYTVLDRDLQNALGLLTDLHNIAKGNPIESFAIDVNDSLRTCMELMRLQAESHAVQLVGHFADESLVIAGDRKHLPRVYRNLIKNALEATGAGGQITITTAREGDEVRISIADTGHGIAPEQLSSIFDDFVTTKKNGLGVGLAVSKHIVEQLHGTIEVASQVGRGTTFTLRFRARDDLSLHAEAS